MKKGFTLAEVLITLAIIGVVAALTIPSVIVNTQQSEFKTGLKKAVSVLNQAITMTAALDGETPYDLTGDGYIIAGDDGSTKNEAYLDLYDVLSKHMSIMQARYLKAKDPNDNSKDAYQNFAFYTTDGMRFEIPVSGVSNKKLTLHETGENNNKQEVYVTRDARRSKYGNTKCGSLGLANNSNGTTVPPCIIIVDVNGDRKPNPSEYVISNAISMTHSGYSYANPNDKKVKDVFTIMITESKAIPFGVVAQRAMYQARDKK